MKRAIVLLVPILLVGAWSAQAQTLLCEPPNGDGKNINNNIVNTTNDQYQTASAIGGGDADSSSTATIGDNINWNDNSSYSEGSIGWSDSDAFSIVNISTVSNVKGRTNPLGTYPPYLPIWNHGGWGTVNAYFPNGPTYNDRVYERVFDPSQPEDMKELKGILTSLSYEGPVHLLGGMLNSISVMFGGPDNFHHGRGVEIVNSLARDRRPEDKPLLVFIDSYVDQELLTKEGYAYVGRISLEGDTDRSWDHLYNAALAEALPWDVDILLISGGMKGVTVGTNISFPSASYGYSQTNYSLSLFGGKSRGITEGKGEAVISATGYRFCPELLERRRIPESLYDRIRKRVPQAAAAAPAQKPAPATASVETPTDKQRVSMATPTSGVRRIRNLQDMAAINWSTMPQ
jgi:hypothetical protein